MKDYIYPPTSQNLVAEENGEDSVRKAAFSVCIFITLPQCSVSIVFWSTLEDFDLFAFNNLVEMVSNTDLL